MYVKKLLLSFLVLTAVSTASFSSVKNSGSIINENPSVRAAAMGYAYTANILEDGFGFFSNPSYVPSYPMLSLSYSMLYKSGKSVSEGASGAFSFLYPSLFWGVNIGIAAVSSFEGNIENEQDCAVYLNLSKQVDFLRIGLNTKYINSKYFRDNDSDFITVDAGLSATFGNFTIGLTGNNLFGDFKNIYGEKINPSLSAGTALDFNIHDFICIFEAGAIQKDLNKNDINPRAGFEIFYKIACLRFGYEYDDNLKDNGTLFAGLGLEIKNTVFDYAFIADQNDSQAGDMHKVAFSYRFYAPPIVYNEQYIQQIKIEKQQAKQKKKMQKDKQFKQVNKKSHRALRKKSLKENVVAPQTARISDYGQEFVAVLTPAESAGRDKTSAIVHPKEEEIFDDDEAEKSDEEDTYDPALYLLRIEQNKDTQPAYKEEKIKTTSFAATPHSKEDYDAAKELLSGSQADNKSKKNKKKKAKKVDMQDDTKPNFKVTSKEIMRQAESNAKAEKAEKTKVYIAVEDGEFDAARYVLENPSSYKVKYRYIKPTKTSKDDFDAATYLLQKEKSETP